MFVCFVYVYFRDEYGVGIEGVSIDVSWSKNSLNKRKSIVSTKEGDYYRLLLQGEYDMIVSVNGTTQRFPIVIKDDHVLVLDMLVSNKSISMQSSQHVAVIINNPQQAPSVMTNTDGGDGVSHQVTLFVVLACIALILVSLLAFTFIFYRKWKVRRGSHPSSLNPLSTTVDF